MHTALCAFQDHATAERARDELLRAGFAREDVHLQRSGQARGASDDEETRQEMLRHHGGVEHEIALAEDVVERVTGFFGHLFGRNHPNRETWDSHVEGGRTVVVVDAHDEEEADRARTLMESLQGTDTSVVHRPEQRHLRDIVADTPMAGDTPLATQPMAPTRSQGWADRSAGAERMTATSERAMASNERDIVGETPAHVESPAATQAAMHGRSTDWTDRAAPARPEERAIATGEQRPLDLGRDEQDADKVGLRYADKGDADKPGTTRDGLGRTRKDE